MVVGFARNESNQQLILTKLDPVCTEIQVTTHNGTDDGWSDLAKEIKTETTVVDPVELISPSVKVESNLMTQTEKDDEATVTETPITKDDFVKFFDELKKSQESQNQDSDLVESDSTILDEKSEENEESSSNTGSTVSEIESSDNYTDNSSSNESNDNVFIPSIPDNSTVYPDSGADSNDVYPSDNSGTTYDPEDSSLAQIKINFKNIRD